jgi:hypothetical protein
MIPSGAEDMPGVPPDNALCDTLDDVADQPGGQGCHPGCLQEQAVPDRLPPLLFRQWIVPLWNLLHV